MTDTELTALAAKAYGDAPAAFSPLTDDGDALRLAVKLDMKIGPNPASNEPMVYAWAPRLPAEYVLVGADPYAATRRAIVRAAAELGRKS